MIKARNKSCVVALAGKNTRRLTIISLLIDHIKFCLLLGKPDRSAVFRWVHAACTGHAGSLCPLNFYVPTVSPFQGRSLDHPRCSKHCYGTVLLQCTGSILLQCSVSLPLLPASSEGWWVITPKGSLRVQHNPCPVSELQFVCSLFTSLSCLRHGEAWLLHSKSFILSTQQRALGEAGKPWPSQVQPSLGCVAEALNPSETPKAALVYKLLLLPARREGLAQACPWSGVKDRPARTRAQQLGWALHQGSVRLAAPRRHWSTSSLQGIGLGRTCSEVFLMPLFFLQAAFHPGLVSFPPHRCRCQACRRLRAPWAGQGGMLLGEAWCSVITFR